MLLHESVARKRPAIVGSGQQQHVSAARKRRCNMHESAALRRRAAFGSSAPIAITRDPIWASPRRLAREATLRLPSFGPSQSGLIP